MEYLVTRVGFCNRCYKAKRPKSADEFIVYGFTSKRFLEMEADHMGLSGFVPHTYKLFTVEDKNKIFMQSVCAMNHCGVDYVFDKDGNKFWTIKRWSKVKPISIRNLRALVKFKDTGFQI